MSSEDLFDVVTACCPTSEEQQYLDKIVTYCFGQKNIGTKSNFIALKYHIVLQGEKGGIQGFLQD